MIDHAGDVGVGKVGHRRVLRGLGGRRTFWQFDRAAGREKRSCPSGRAGYERRVCRRQRRRSPPMRHLLPALIITLSLTNALPAQPRPQFIKWPEIEVRSGPTKEFDATGVLRKNAQVMVKKAANGQEFVEILPPQGSVSWIPKAVVTKMGEPANGRQNFRVTGNASDPPVPIVPGGSNMAAGPLPKAQKLDVPRGTQGYIRGAPVRPSWDDREWYPIDPLPGESRFIPAKALEEPS